MTSKKEHPNQCQGYVPEEGQGGTCKHGFPQEVFPCLKGIGKPVCLQEEWCAVLFKNTGGKPIQRIKEIKHETPQNHSHS